MVFFVKKGLSKYLLEYILSTLSKWLDPNVSPNPWPSVKQLTAGCRTQLLKLMFLLFFDKCPTIKDPSYWISYSSSFLLCKCNVFFGVEMAQVNPVNKSSNILIRAKEAEGLAGPASQPSF